MRPKHVAIRKDKTHTENKIGTVEDDFVTGTVLS